MSIELNVQATGVMDDTDKTVAVQVGTLYNERVTKEAEQLNETIIAANEEAQSDADAANEASGAVEGDEDFVVPELDPPVVPTLLDLEDTGNNLKNAIEAYSTWLMFDHTFQNYRNVSVGKEVEKRGMDKKLRNLKPEKLAEVEALLDENQRA